MSDRNASDPEVSEITSASAPDLGDVRAWLQKMLKAMRFAQLIVSIVGLIGRMRDLNTELTRRLSHLQRKRPRSETLERIERQLTLPFAQCLGVEPVAGSEPQPPPERKPKRSRRGRHPGRAPLPEHLPRVEMLNAVPADKRICPQCGSEMTTVGHEVCETLEIEPARVFVVRRKDERVACPHDDAIVSAPKPPELVERGKLGPTLIIESLCDKYIEYQPIERQCLRWRRTGVDIAPQTLGRSVAVAIDLLTPVAKEIIALTRGSALLATDATGIPVLDRDAPDGIRTGTMWCWLGDDAWVTFVYSAIGDSASVQRFLGDDLRRTVQCDGTNLTTFLERAGGKRPGCWSHARRRLVEAARAGDATALTGLRTIRRLFAVERLSALARDTPEQRKARRDEHSVTVLAELRAWVDRMREVTPPKTPLGKALGYLHRQWARLLLFLTDGRIELTNNRVERELRRLVLGRKNWLFVWEDLGGDRAATVLTLVGTCIAQHVNPRAYLHRVTKLLVQGWPMARLRELLPDQLARVYPELRMQGRGTAPALLPAPS